MFGQQFIAIWHVRNLTVKMVLSGDGANQHQQAPKYIRVLVKQSNSVYERWCIKRWFDEEK